MKVGITPEGSSPTDFHCFSAVHMFQRRPRLKYFSSYKGFQNRKLIQLKYSASKPLLRNNRMRMLRVKGLLRCYNPVVRKLPTGVGSRHDKEGAREAMREGAEHLKQQPCVFILASQLLYNQSISLFSNFLTPVNLIFSSLSCPLRKPEAL